MGILQRLKDAVRASANALIDKAADPARKVDLLIGELEEQFKVATRELITYKATEKRLAAEAAALWARADEWQKRAEAAVLAGDDALAKEALVEKGRIVARRAQVERERAEQAEYAAALLRGRREVQNALTSLQLRKGTVAQNVAAARVGGDTVLETKGPAWDALARAEESIGQDAALAEVEALVADPLAEGDAAVEARLRERLKETRAEEALAELKKKMGQ